MELEKLRELFNSPGWEAYLEQIEIIMTNLFIEMLALEPSEPQNFIKFVELKSRINQLRDTTYLMELDTASGPEKIGVINETYKGIISRLFRRIFLGGKHG